jgi:hypothetical protein
MDRIIGFRAEKLLGVVADRHAVVIESRRGRADKVADFFRVPGEFAEGFVERNVEKVSHDGVSLRFYVAGRPMQPFQGSAKAAAAGALALQASERPRLPQGNGLGSLPGPAAALEPLMERLLGGMSSENAGRERQQARMDKRYEQASVGE